MPATNKTLLSNRNRTVLIAGLSVAIALAAAGVRAEQVYFILHGAGPGGVPERGPVAIDRSTGQRIGPQQEYFPPLALDTIGTTTGRGTGFRVLLQSRDKEKERMVGINVSPDGTLLICHELIEVSPGQFGSRLLILKPDGEIVRTTDLAAQGLRVFGAPVFIADGKRIGMSIGGMNAGQAPRGNSAAERRFKGYEYDGKVPNQFQWMRRLGQATVATMDADGHNLQHIGVGALPCWSPDGKSILFTELKLNEGKQPSFCRLCLMDADGKNAHPLAPEMTCDGSFSPNGTQILYVGSPQSLFVADADGTHARRIPAEKSDYSSPRWITNNRIAAAESRNVWSMDLMGRDRQRLSPASVRKHPAQNGSSFDSDAGLIADLCSNPHRQANGTGAAESASAPDASDSRPTVTYKPVPAGYTVQFRGTEVYLRDAQGKLTPMPDGEFQLPDGRKIRVRAGHSIIISN